jgi:retron-type reverse transcriptase
MHDRGKSDGPVVPAKPPNNAADAAAEAVEERGPAKGNTAGKTRPGLRAGVSAPSALGRVRRVAQQDKEARFTALLHHVDLERLRAAYWALEPKAAPGVDGVTWVDYGQDLEGNLRGLHARVHRGAYRARPSRRAYIPKADGRLRPLGIAALEDKILQRAVVEVLGAIYEADFLGFSYGFRPGRSPHDALDALATGITRKKVGWVLDADIRDFFTKLDQAWMGRFLEHRIADKRVLRLIQKWMRAGVIEDGAWTACDEGVPQGASASPLLANVYLHYVFDLWAHQWRRRHARGDVVIVRFADDCAPRTRKEDLSRSRVRRMRCCARDEGAGPVGPVALRGRPAGGGRKPPRGAPVKSRGAELAETARLRAGQVWITKASASEPLMRRRKRIGDIETGVESLLRDEPGECLLIGRAVSGVKVARAWSGLSCGTREPVAPTGWPASGAVLSCGRSSQARTPSSGNCEGESSCAGHRGGPSRSSGEGPVIGLERRGRVVLAGLTINHRLVGGVG